MQEPAVLLLSAKAHDPLNADAVIPAAVEQDDVAAGGQVPGIALEVPLGLFPLGRRGQRDDLGNPRVEVLRHPLDRAALSRRVPALEDHDDPGVLGSHPLLQFHELGLQPEQLLLIQRPLQPSCRATLGAPAALALAARTAASHVAPPTRLPRPACYPIRTLRRPHPGVPRPSPWKYDIRRGTPSRAGWFPRRLADRAHRARSSGH